MQTFGTGKVGNIEKLGDWARAGIVLRRGGVKINEAMQDRIRKDAETLLEAIKNNIRNNAFNNPPKSQGTLEYEGAANDTPWVWTEQLLNNIKVTVRENDKRRGRYTLFIGVKEGVSSIHRGVDLNTIAQWLEFGNANQPPRPVFQPTLIENEQPLMSGWKKLVGQTIARAGR